VISKRLSQHPEFKNSRNLFFLDLRTPDINQISEDWCKIPHLGTMANKLDPHDLVALMYYVFEGRQDGSSSSLNPTPIDPQTSSRPFRILDVLASLSISEAGSQVVAVSLQLNSRKREIRLMVTENQEVDSRLVDYLKSIWGNLQALSEEFAAKRGSDMHEEGSPSILGEMALQLNAGLFREIYKHSLKKQMNLKEKWWSLLVDFVKKLFIRRERSLQGVEFNLYQVVTGLDSVFQLACKLHGPPGQELTDDEWKVVYYDSVWANQKARLVLVDQNNFGCELLAQELNGTPLLTPIMVLGKSI